MLRKKALNAKRCKTKNIGHFKQEGNMASLFRTLTKGKKSTDKLLPGWSQHVASALIWEAAIIFDWDPTV